MWSSEIIIKVNMSTRKQSAQRHNTEKGHKEGRVFCVQTTKEEKQASERALAALAGRLS